MYECFTKFCPMRFKCQISKAMLSLHLLENQIYYQNIEYKKKLINQLKNTFTMLPLMAALSFINKYSFSSAIACFGLKSH